MTTQAVTMHELFVVENSIYPLSSRIPNLEDFCVGKDVLVEMQREVSIVLMPIIGSKHSGSCSYTRM